MPRIVSVWQHKKHRTCYIREPIPKELQAAHGGQTYKRSLGVKLLADAAKAYPSALVVFYAYLESLRRGPLTLTAMQVEALVGVWYRKNLDEWSHDPGSVEGWEGSWFSLPTGGDPDDGKARARLMAPEVQALLDSEGLQVDDVSRAALADRLFRRKLELYDRMETRAGGDFSPDPKLVQFPAWSNPVKAPAPEGPAVTFATLIDKWAAKAERPLKSVKENRAIVEAFKTFVSHDDPARVETDDVERWRDSLLISGPSGRPLKRKTVQGKYLSAVSAVYSVSQGKGRGRLQGNPVDGAWFEGRHFTDSRDVRPYTAGELAAILRASRGESAPERRWLSWVMVYTGTRLREAAQCIASDVKELAGVIYLDINRDHEWKRLKAKPGQRSPSARDIPLHSHLIGEGFPEYVKSLAPGDFLFPRIKPRADGQPNEGRPVDALRTWLASFAVPEGAGSRRFINPSHSFRHAFEDALRNATEDHELRLDIQGRADGSSARGYGDGHALLRKRDVIERIPPLC
ncbi:MAG: hypothetical protein ACT4PZ_06965 [Panacagrimonas sp.]